MSQSRHLRDGNKPIPINDQVKIPPVGLAVRCTRDLANEIAQDIVKGGTPHVCAAAHGVSPNRFREWLHLGHLAAEQGDLSDPHGYLYVAVYLAAGQARLGAEQWVFARNPESWLAYLLGTQQLKTGAQQEMPLPHAEVKSQGQLTIEAEMRKPGSIAEAVAIIQQLGLTPAQLGVVESTPEEQPAKHDAEKGGAWTGSTTEPV
jgi:hypothetical protein